MTIEKPDIDLEYYNHTCYIVGGGPSLTDFDWSKLTDKFIIAINRAYEMIPDAQILYCTDKQFLKQHKNKMIPHPGILYYGRTMMQSHFNDPNINEIPLAGSTGFAEEFGTLYHGANSGFACLQLAYQLGFTTIYLLGYDMKHNGKFVKGKTGNYNVTHWHSGHHRTDSENVYNKMKDNISSYIAPVLKKKGITVINVNEPDKTALKCFPIKSREEVFQ